MLSVSKKWCVWAVSISYGEGKTLLAKTNFNGNLYVSISYGEGKTADVVIKYSRNYDKYQSPMEKVKPVYLTSSVWL